MIWEITALASSIVGFGMGYATRALLVKQTMQDIRDEHISGIFDPDIEADVYDTTELETGVLYRVDTPVKYPELLKSYNVEIETNVTEADMNAKHGKHSWRNGK